MGALRRSPLSCAATPARDSSASICSSSSVSTPAAAAKSSIQAVSKSSSAMARMLQVGAVDPTSPSSRTTGVSAIVLAGGRSSRFGADKCRAACAGTPVLQRVLDRVEDLRRSGRVDEVVVVGPWAPEGVHLELEPIRFLGPLAGLAHALDTVDTDVVLVLAGDHPLLATALLELLVDRALTTPAVDAVVPVGPDGPEPLVACYRRSVRAVVQQRLDRDRRSLRGLLDELSVDWIGREVWSRVDRSGVSFLDVDTPEDLTALAQVAREQPAGGDLDAQE